MEEIKEVSGMDDIQQNRNKRKRPVVRYLISLLAGVTIIAGVALSRYVSSVSGTDTVRAAQFDYEIHISRNTYDKIGAPYDAKIEFIDNSNNPADLNTITSNDTKQVEFLVSLYATSMLADADACQFDEVVRVIDVTFTNTSEVAVNAIISNIADISKVDGGIGTGNGIVWCLFHEADNYTGYGDILGKLNYPGTSSVPADYDILIDDLNKANAKTLADWNADNVLEPNTQEKTLTIVFWAEHEAVADSGWDFEKLVNNSSGPLDQSIHIDYAVTQVD